MAMDEEAGLAACQGPCSHSGAERGADFVFQTRAQASSLHLALRALRPQGTVIDLAFYQGGSGALRLGEEFHHNGLTIRCAQINRVPRGLGHIWDRRRLANETIALLQADGDSIRAQMITHVMPFDDGPAFLSDLVENRPEFVQIVFKVARLTANRSPCGFCSSSPGWWSAARKPKCGCWRKPRSANSIGSTSLPASASRECPSRRTSNCGALGVDVDTSLTICRSRTRSAIWRGKIAGYDMVISCQNVADIYPALERLHLRPPLIEHGGLVSEALAGPKHLTNRYVGVCRTILDAAASKMPGREQHAVEIPSMVDLASSTSATARADAGRAWHAAGRRPDRLGRPAGSEEACRGFH